MPNQLPDSYYNGPQGSQRNTTGNNNPFGYPEEVLRAGREPAVTAPATPVAAAQKKATAKDFETGELVSGKGVYFGIWMPRDRDGASLGKTFNVFAAPEDLTDASGKKVLLTFNDAVKCVASKKNWHSHDGANFANDAALYAALKIGSYNGEWFIPTSDLLFGRNIDRKKVQWNNLYKNKDAGALKNTFTTIRGSVLAHWYWSLSEPRDDASLVYGVAFTEGDVDWVHKDFDRLSSRVVRAELRP